VNEYGTQGRREESSKLGGYMTCSSEKDMGNLREKVDLGNRNLGGTHLSGFLFKIKQKKKAGHI